MAYPTELEWLQSINRVKSYVNLSDEPDNLVLLATLLLNTNATSNLNISNLGQAYPGDITQTVYLDAANNFTPVLYSRKYNVDTLVYDVNELTLTGATYNPVNPPAYILSNAPTAPVGQSFNIVPTYYDAVVNTSEFSIRDELVKLTVYINSVPQPPIWVNNTTGLTLTTNPVLPTQATPALDTTDSLLTFIKLYTEQSKLNLVDVVTNTNLANTFLSAIEQIGQDLLTELVNLKDVASGSAATLGDIKAKNTVIGQQLDTVIADLFTLFTIETGVNTLVNKLGAVENYLTTTQNTKLTSIDTKLTNIDNALSSGVNGLKVDGSAVTQPVSVTSLPLPTGAATQLTAVEINNNLEIVSAKLTTLNTSVTNLQTDVVTLPTVLAVETGHIASVDAKLTTTVDGLKVDGSAVVQPISVNALPLPSGAATALKQDTTNLKLDTLTGKDFATENTLVNAANTAHADSLVVKSITETISTQLTTSNDTLVEIKDAADVISNKDFATAANQATEIARLNTINTTIDTKTDSIIIAQNTIVTKLTAIDSDAVTIGDRVATTNTLLTNISNKDFASETSLSAIKDAILSNVNLSETTWTDDSGTFFLREVTQDQQTQAKIITFTLLDGTLYTPSTNPRPADKTLVIDQPLTNTQLRANPVAVSGDFYLATQPISAASLPLPTGAATNALQIDTNTLLTQVSIAQTSVDNKITDTNAGITTVISNTTGTNTKLDTVNTKLTDLTAKIPTDLTVNSNKLLVDGSGATQPVSQVGTWNVTSNHNQPLTDTQLRANPVDTNVVNTVAVSGAFYPTTQAVSVTDLPLPTEAATSANQVTNIDLLTDVNTQLTTLNTEVATINSTALTNLNTSATSSLTKLTSLDSKAADTLTYLNVLNNKLPNLANNRIVVDGSGVTQPISGTVDTGLVQPLTNTQLRSSALLVTVTNGNSGELPVTLDGLLENKLGVCSVYIINEGSGYIDNDPVIFNGGTEIIPAEGTLVVNQGKVLGVRISNPGYYSVLPTSLTANTGTGLSVALVTGNAVTLQLFDNPYVKGLITGAALDSVYFEVSTNGYTWLSTTVTDVNNSTQITQVNSFPCLFNANATGALYFRLRRANLNVSPSQSNLVYLSATEGSFNVTTNSLTDTQLRATPVPVSIGTLPNVTIANFPATQPVNATTLPLPTGAATETTLSNVNIKLPAGLTVKPASVAPVNSDPALVVAISPNTPVTTNGLTDIQLRASAVPVSGNFYQPTQPISAAALPLPTGASTSSLQTIGNSFLSSIDIKTPSLGQALATSSVPVVLTAAQVTALSPLSTVAVTQSGGWSVTANTGLAQPLTDTQLRATSLSVTGTFFQATQPISAVNLPLPTGAATSGNQTTGNNSLISIDSKLVSPVVLTDAVSNPTISSNASLGFGFNGVTWDRLRAGIFGVQSSPIGILNTLPMARYKAGSAYVLTDGQVAELQVNSNGALRVKDISVAANDGTAVALQSSLGAALYNSSSPTASASGNQLALQCDINGNLKTLTTIIGSIPTGSNVIGSISNTGFNINGLLPTFSSTPTFNVGTTNGLALDTSVNNLLKPSSTLNAVTTVGSISNALPTGTNNIGQVTANAGTNLNTSALALENGGRLASIDTKTPVLGQALAINSVPVVLTAAQLDTLTPLSTLTAIGSITNALPSGSNTIGNTNQTLTTSGFSKLTDGTNTATVLTSAPTSDTGQSALAVRVVSQLAAGAVEPSLTGNGNIVLINNAVTLNLNGQYANAVFQISGVWTGTLVFEASNDNFTTVTTINALRAGDNTISQTVVDSTNNDFYRVTVAAFGYIRVRATSVITGTAVITAIASTKTSGVFLNFPIPPGSNTIGAVNVNGTVSVNDINNVDNTSLGTLSAASQTVTLSIFSKSAATIQISGTWVGTITFEGSIDGVTFNSINAVAASTSQPQSTTTVNGLYRLTPAGLLQIRAIMTAFTSGSASISMRVSPSTGGVFVNQVLPVKITDDTKDTYSATAINFAAANLATDIFTIFGSATKIVKIKRIIIAAVQQAGAVRDVIFIKRSTLNTGGTSTTLTSVPHDSNSVSATAFTRSYTANPTVGTFVGNIRATKLFINTSATVLTEYIVDFETLKVNAPFVLRNVNESISINLNGVTSTANSFTITCTWTEE